MSEEFFSVSGLTTSLNLGGRWHPVVRDLSFTLKPRETLAIVGESGSGKSMTAQSIMRLTPQGISKIEGSVRLQGRELQALSEAEMRKVRGNDITMIFQEPMMALNPVLTIGYQIAESLILHTGCTRAEARKESIRLLDRVRIPSAKSRFDEYPHRFSGGMRQRVAIAMALACKPKVLIADEPTTALDVTIQAQILELIKTLQEEEGMAVIFITHDMGVVAEIAERMVVMYQGEQIEVGATADVFRAPRQPYTKALLSAISRLGSMSDKTRPLRFPVVDRRTGESDIPTEVPDTVDNVTRPLLEVSGLTTRFDVRSGAFGSLTGRVHAVENLSFSISKGETLALVGESGCGKSTTGRSILRLIEPDAGSVKLDGVDVLKLPPAELREQRKRMQIIFQDPFASLDPRMSVGDAIAAPLRINKLGSRGEIRAKVEDLIERVGLTPDVFDRLPHEFSGGQRQRLSIARALAVEPRLIVADEAVSALDVSIKAQVVNLMLDLQAQFGLSYLFISHDMAVVERVSHRVAVMHLGEIVEIGPRGAIFDNPQHDYTKRLLSAVPIADPARRSIRPVSSGDEAKSPFRLPDFQPPKRMFREVTPGHLVMHDAG